MGASVGRGGTNREADVRRVQTALVRHGHPSVDHEADLSKVPARLAECVRPGDLVLTLGAGNVFKVAEAFVALDAASDSDETGRKS